MTEARKLQLAALRRPVSFILVFILLWGTAIVLFGQYEVDVDLTEGRADTSVRCSYSGDKMVCTDDVHAFYGGFAFQIIALIGFVLMLVATFQISLGHEYGFWSLFGKDRLPKDILIKTAIAGGVIALVGLLGYVLLTGDETDKWGARYNLPTDVWQITIPIALVTILIMAAWLKLPHPAQKSQ